MKKEIIHGINLGNYAGVPCIIEELTNEYGSSFGIEIRKATEVEIAQGRAVLLKEEWCSADEPWGGCDRCRGGSNIWDQVRFA